MVGIFDSDEDEDDFYDAMDHSASQNAGFLTPDPNNGNAVAVSPPVKMEKLKASVKVGYSGLWLVLEVSLQDCSVKNRLKFMILEKDKTSYSF